MTDQPQKPHAPLPWVPNWKGEPGWIYSPSGNCVIAKMIHEIGIVGPDAEFICRAVNCFDELLSFVKLVANDRYLILDSDFALEDAMNLIDKAEGKQQ